MKGIITLICCGIMLIILIIFFCATKKWDKQRQIGKHQSKPSKVNNIIVGFLFILFILAGIVLTIVQWGEGSNYDYDLLIIDPRKF